jgi:hypothetical protein
MPPAQADLLRAQTEATSANDAKVWTHKARDGQVR